MDTFDDIYYSLLGEYMHEYALPWVEDAFLPGSVCYMALTRIWEARLRLAQRLGSSEEDPDLLVIVDGYEEIQLELCRRMYLFGSMAGE